MNYLFGYGFPFDPNFSSCSNRKPINFEWKYPENGSIDHLVLLDNAILAYEQLPPIKLYGWVCESRSIVSQVSQFLSWNYNKIEARFTKVFVSDKNLTNLSPVFEYCPAGSNLPWIQKLDYAIYDKTKLVSMVASWKQTTKGHMIRHAYADRYKDRIELFGGACGSPRLPNDIIGQPWLNKIEGLKDYMFSIVIENDFYDNYYTEKITDCFATGTIPIYLGSPSINENFNMDGVIKLDANFNIDNITPELYYSKLDAIEDNFNRVRELKSADDILWEKINETINN